MKGYNRLRVMNVWQRGDATKQPKPDSIIVGLGDGAEQSHYIRNPWWSVEIKKMVGCTK